MAESKKRSRLTQSKLNFSQPSQSPAKRGGSEKRGTGVSAEDLERLVNDTVYYLLISDQHKETIKKKDIQKHVLNNSGKAMRAVLASAKEKLQDVFGVELVELDDKQGSVILVRKVDLSEFSQFLQISDKVLARQGLITLVLALILMNHGIIHEASLWKMLKPYGLDPNSSNPVFGDVRKLICVELVKQAYIEQSVVLGSDPPVNQYQWGVRAKKEFSKRSVLEIVCKVMGQGTRLEHYASVYNEIVHFEQAN